jgi:hypothetical protein
VYGIAGNIHTVQTCWLSFENFDWSKLFMICQDAEWVNSCCSWSSMIWETAHCLVGHGLAWEPGQLVHLEWQLGAVVGWLAHFDHWFWTDVEQRRVSVKLFLQDLRNIWGDKVNEKITKERSGMVHWVRWGQGKKKFYPRRSRLEWQLGRRTDNDSDVVLFNKSLDGQDYKAGWFICHPKMKTLWVTGTNHPAECFY